MVRYEESGFLDLQSGPAPCVCRPRTCMSLGWTIDCSSIGWTLYPSTLIPCSSKIQSMRARSFSRMTLQLSCPKPPHQVLLDALAPSLISAHHLNLSLQSKVTLC